jgi:hypothetical protein
MLAVQRSCKYCAHDSKKPADTVLRQEHYRSSDKHRDTDQQAGLRLVIDI